MPSIEIKLSPPENPLPQVSHTIDNLEERRLQVEREMMAKLEDRFNETLVDSRDKIKQIIDQQFSILYDEELRTSILEAIDRKKSSPKKKNGHIVAPSFLQTDEMVVPSSVRVMMTDVEAPDPTIKPKMEQIEQSRTYEEIQMFHQQADEFEQLTNVTLIELENSLKLQLEPYVAHMEKMRSQTYHGGNAHTTSAASFLQVEEHDFLNPKQLNVKIGQSDDPYPTVEDYVMNMEKRRDAAERNERNTVLAMYLKLVKAQHEIIRDELRSATSKIISHYGGSVDEATKHQIRRHGK
ncbi:hypothetical protein BgAZ_400040 [Babesia gibsoni]|uniref:Uncharacterized protein n=1 Tax=Babesia gibsoni TaxID=33632 RepID=A0AAD8LGW7_BABGI|nr:hypothetical protein BgAZ_400040 [Babesia gibsoni]